MLSIIRILALVLLACLLLGGCGSKTQLPAPAAPVKNAPRYTADNSVCRWSEPQCFACGGGGGDEFIAPIDTTSDAVVSELVGDSPAFSPDGKLVATAGNEEVRGWRAADGKPAFTVAGNAFVFSPDSRSLAVQQAEEWMLWDIADKEEQLRLADPAGRLFFSADGQTIVTEEGRGGRVRLYDAETGARRLELRDVSSPVAISPNGELLAGIMGKDAGQFDIDVIVVWDTATGAEVQVLQAEIQSQIPLAGVRGHREIDSIAFSPDGEALLSAGRDALRLWDTASGEHLRCFQTPGHAGARQAVWSVDGNSIIGTATGEFAADQDIYLWDAAASHPKALLWLGRGRALPVGLSVDAQSGSILAWSALDYDDTGDRRAYLWDLNSRQLLGVLPTTGLMTDAALSPTGERAVTVSAYERSHGHNPYYSSIAQETLLWDTTHGGVALAAAAQQSYWDALAAAVNGAPPEAQLRPLRKAQSLSPELFTNIENLSEQEQLWYADFLQRVEMLETLASDSSEAAETFYAEISDVTPKWSEWSGEELVGQVSQLISFWPPGDTAELVRSYQEFAELDPETARTGEVLAALVDGIAPGAAALAQEGELSAATAIIQEALALYPDLDMEPEGAAAAIYAQTFVNEGRYLAQYGGDIAGAVNDFEQALAIDPTLSLEPESEANRLHAQGLVSEAKNLARYDGDLAGAVAKYEEALALDPSLSLEPEIEAKREVGQALVDEGNSLAQGGDVAEAAAVYAEALALDPSLSIDPELKAHRVYAQVLVDEGDNAAAEGDLTSATALYEEALALHPFLSIEPELKAKRARGQALVDEADNLAAEGDLASATALYEEALALDPSRSLEPETEARNAYSWSLISEGGNLAAEDDNAGAVAKFEEALALDPSLATSPPGYAQVYCALHAETAPEEAGSFCSELNVNVAPIAVDETVTATLAPGVVDFWSIEAVSPMDVTLDLLVGGKELALQLYLYAPDGSMLGEQDFSLRGRAHLEASLPQEGRYLVSAAETWREWSGTYQLTLKKGNP